MSLAIPAQRPWWNTEMADENGSIRLSLSTVQFLIQLAVFILAISAWGWTIKSDVRVQAVEQGHQKEKVEELTRRVEMLRLDVQSLQMSLASKGIITLETK